VVFLVILTSLLSLWKQNKYSLVGTYFSDQNLGAVYSTRHDPQIDFNWGYGPPILGFKEDSFSVRWSGYIIVTKPGEYEFITDTDDGVRLIIDGKKIIEDWNTHSVVRNTGTASLSPGPHFLILEYFENNAAAVVKLSWKVPGALGPEIIPSIFFRSDRKYIEHN